MVLAAEPEYNRVAVDLAIPNDSQYVAGIIGAECNKGIGVTGVNWNVTLVPLQAANDVNRFDIDDVIEEIGLFKINTDNKKSRR